jgi:hypothetical protein
MARYRSLFVLLSLSTMIAACSPKGLDDGSATDSTSSTSSTSTTTGETGMETGTETGTETADTTETETETGDPGECADQCENPEPVAEGLVRCADGSVNRIGPGTFDPTIGGEACLGDEDTIHCTSDADCIDAPHGACRRYTAYEASEEFLVCGCRYSCASDEDCLPGQACIPPDVVPGTRAYPYCAYVDCQTGDDCECGECGLSGGVEGCDGSARVACRTATDACRSHLECWSMMVNSCQPSALGWFCEDSGCTP